MRRCRGTLAGGADTSAPAVLEIALVAVNAPPVFALSRTEVLVAQDSGAVTLVRVDAPLASSTQNQSGQWPQRAFTGTTTLRALDFRGCEARVTGPDVLAVLARVAGANLSPRSRTSRRMQGTANGR